MVAHSVSYPDQGKLRKDSTGSESRFATASKAASKGFSAEVGGAGSSDHQPAEVHTHAIQDDVHLPAYVEVVYIMKLDDLPRPVSVLPGQVVVPRRETKLGSGPGETLLSAAGGATRERRNGRRANRRPARRGGRNARRRPRSR